MYLRIVSVIRGSHSLRRVYVACEIRRVRARDGNGDPCAQCGDKGISSGFVTAEDRDHASQTRRWSSAISLIFLFQLDRRHQRKVTARSRARSWLLEICQWEIGKTIVRMLRISLNYNLSMSNERRTVLYNYHIGILSFRFEH